MVTVSLKSQRADRGGIVPHHDQGVVNTWTANTRLRQEHQVIINCVTTEATVPIDWTLLLASILINCVRIFRCCPAPSQVINGAVITQCLWRGENLE